MPLDVFGLHARYTGLCQKAVGLVCKHRVNSNANRDRDGLLQLLILNEEFLVS